MDSVIRSLIRVCGHSSVAVTLSPRMTSVITSKHRSTMMDRITFRVGLLMFLMLLCAPLGSTETINPLKNPRICGRPECITTANDKFRYNTTVQYTYAYRTHVRTEFLGSGQNQSDVYVDATALLTFPQACEGILKLRNVKLRDEYVNETTTASSDSAFRAAKEYSINIGPMGDKNTNEDNLHPHWEPFAVAMEQTDLRFAYHDGLIEEVCPDPSEPTWVLNFKKGLLSMLQNTMRRFDIDYSGTETDVTGTCPISYMLFGAEGTSLLLQKTKDLAACTNRYKTHSFLQTVPYQFRQNIAVWPILKSTSSCNISVDHHIYKDVQCYERHQLEPFSNKQTGAVTHSHARLLLQNERIVTVVKPQIQYYGNDDQIGIPIRSTLLFDHYSTPKNKLREIKVSRDLLIQMCTAGFPNIKPEFNEVFTKFLHTARHLSHSALYQLLTRSVSMCGDDQNGKYHVLEALPHIGSSASVRIMCDEIIGQRLPVNKVHNWLSSMVLLNRPDDEMLDALLRLMEHAEAHRTPKYILVGTSVAHTYCRNRRACSESPAIRQIVLFLENELKKSLIADFGMRSNRDWTVVLLKGIGNVGVAPPLLAQLLHELATSTAIPTEYRLQAIYAHIRMDCRRSRNTFLDLYENMDENSEIRIAAYQQVMRCPSKLTVKRIKSVLQIEEVNQVGSYVWSSLSNLAKSSSPLNVEVQSLLVDEELSSRFKMDMRKFSRNFEHSLFFDEYNVGTRYDANLIFGTESYMPRTVGFNMSADLFGESVNLFEVSARMGGLEQLVEKAFGASGSMNAKYFGDKFTALSKLWTERFSNAESKLLDKIRIRRSAADENGSPRFDNETLLGQLYDSVHKTGYKLNYTFNHPHVALSTKVFGNDIAYHTIDGEAELYGTIYAYDPVQQLRSIFSGRQINYTKSGVMLDIAYEVPLGTGLPLAIHAFGATSVDLRMSGALNNLNWAGMRLDIAARLKASAALEITATMRTDYFVDVAGIRVKANMYTSSAVDATVKVDGLRSASLQLSLPQDRNDIFSAHSELLVMKRDMDVPQRGIERRYVAKSTCTWSFVESIIGLRICSGYSVPDVNNPAMLEDGSLAVYPSLLLSGPVSLNIHLSKSDVSAKTFLFEYHWDEAAPKMGGRQGSLSFHTPDSRIVRVFTANLTSNPDNYNVAMSFQNGPLQYLASGTLQWTDKQKSLNVFVILNGKTNFACEMGYNATAVRNGFRYLPLFLLTINDERIAGLTGSIKAIDKKGVKQYDVNLEFETKKARAALNGYITKTELTTTPKLTLSYLFENRLREEFVELSGELSSRGQKSRTDYSGFVRINSTAYPQFNFVSNMKFVSVLGHVEATVDFNNAIDLLDPNYKLTLRLIFAHLLDSIKGVMRTTGTFEVTRPRNNIDFTIHLKNEEKNKNGAEHNLFALVRVAPKKEGTAALSILFPRSQFFAVDAALNITVPSFDSCTAALRWIGTRENEYTIDARGGWFTGHSIAANGMFQDISTQVKIHKHLKLLVTSPSFNETNVDIRFSRDEEEASLGVDIEHGLNPYELQMKHRHRSPEPQTSFMGVRVIDKMYSIQVQLERKDRRQLLVDIHLDNVRDIHVALRGYSNAGTKEFGIDIQWDANRDPTQKIAISVDLSTPHPQHMEGGFIVAYPDRSFSGSFDVDTATAEWLGNARIGWSASESLAVHVIVGSNWHPAKQAWLQVHLTTPFEHWLSNRLRTDLYYHENKLLTNGSLSWGNEQSVAMSLATNYVHSDVELLCEFRSELNSSVIEVPNALASFRHHYRGSNAMVPHVINTDVHLRHSRPGEVAHVLYAQSAWTADIGRHRTNRTVKGSVQFRSPLPGYRLGGLYAKFAHDDDQRLSGAVALNLESNKYRAFIDGYAHRLTDSMFSLNVTTPIEKFAHVMCRLGISDRERHAVAEVRLPASALGVELMWAVEQLNDFNVLFSVATPLEAFQRVMLVARMHRDTIDMRGAVNKLMLGFVGVWKSAGDRDVEYSYRVFTPLANFAENGVVVKLLRVEGVELEVSGRVGKNKIGLVFNVKPKLPLSKLVGTQPQHSVYFSAESLTNSNEMITLGDVDLQNESTDSETDDDDADEDDDHVPLNYMADIEVDTMMWPTISGQMEIEEIGDDITALGKIKVPMGEIIIKDCFRYPDYFNVSNTLKLSTSFGHEIQLKYMHDVDIGSKYAAGLDIIYRPTVQQKDVIQLGLDVNYTKVIEPDTRAHQLQLSLRTPIYQLERIDFHCLVVHDDGVYRANMTTSTPDTRVSVGGSFEAEPRYLDTAMSLQLSAPTVPRLALNVFLKKVLSDDAENRIECGFTFDDNDLVPSKIRLQSVWHSDPPGQMRSSVKLQTNLCAVHELDASVHVQRSVTQSINAALGVTMANGQRIDYQANGLRNYELVNVEVSTPVQQFGNFSMHGVLKAVTGDKDLDLRPETTSEYQLEGTCSHSSGTFPLNGIVRFDRDVPVVVNLKQTNGVGEFGYSLSHPKSGYGHRIQSEVIIDSQRHVRLDGELSMFSKLNWGLNVNAHTSPGLLGAVDSGSKFEPEQTIELGVSMRPNVDGMMTTSFALNTPWKQLGLDTVRMQANLTLQGDAGELQHRIELAASQTEGAYQWHWSPHCDMQARARTEVRTELAPKRVYIMAMKYVDHGSSALSSSSSAATSVATTAAPPPAVTNTPVRVLLSVGVQLNVDDRWHLQTNGTWRTLPGELGGTLVVRLPTASIGAVADVHKLSGQYRGNLKPEALDLANADVNYDVRYETDVSRRRFASRGQYRNVADLQGAMRVEWGVDEQRQAAETNVQMLRKEQRREFSARMATPWYVTEDTIRASGYYDVRESGEQLIRCSLNYPASAQIANTDVAFTSLENMKGFANCTTPYANLTWLKGEFDFVTTGAESNRYLKATWPTDSAFFDLRNKYTSQNLDRDLHGRIKMSVPLATKHTANIVYGLKDRMQLSTGNCAVHYNDERVLDGQYTSKSESRAGYEREVVDITLQNPRKPLGIAYVHVSNFSDPEWGEYDMKRAEVFDLEDHTSFNITGEFHVHSTETGHDIKLVAVHPNRTPVVLTTMYDLQERTTRTKSKLLLSPDIWVAYDVALHNHTTDELESRSVHLELSYPRRNLSTSGWYSQEENSFLSNVDFAWTNEMSDKAASESTSNNDYDHIEYAYDDDTSITELEDGPRTVQAALEWHRYPSAEPSERNHSLALTVHHPSFEQNVTLAGSYRRNAIDLLGIDFHTEYCKDPDHRLQINALLRDVSDVVGYRNFTYGVTAVHKATELDLMARGSMSARSGLYAANNEAVYKRSFLPVQEGFLIGKLDVIGKEVHLWKTSPQKTFRLWAISDGIYPVYRLNASLENSPDVNSTGRFYANVDDKFVQLNVNMTPDASQNLRMVGTIPDARSATFDLWRDYEEFRVVDVAYYLRMNHSRLITSKLEWRPTIKAEVKGFIKETAVGFYDSISETADYWLKTVYAESKDSVRDIWESSKPYTEKFLNDVSGLQVLEGDLTEFRLFVNQSYEANDFYVKSMVNVTMTVLDELSLRNHIDSVPKILSEIWLLLGETGSALRKSIIWVMESVRSSYDKALEMIGRLFKGDAMEHLTGLMEMGLAKYDKIVKDLHLSFIKYVEQTWSRITNAVSSYWYATLRRLEPQLMQMYHYVESMAFSMGKEVFEFLYKRTNEIVDSPYFAKVSVFTQDMDTLYRDIAANDVITNVRKYSVLAWQFLRAKYFVLVPFGHELNEICNEMLGELRKLYTLEPVQFVAYKVSEMQAQLTWFANELQLEKRAMQLWHIVRQKITTFGQTALETDDKYREAKTQFVFDPDVGLMELQQKLPMSWHAFNETPIVEEIHEYKTLLRFTSMFQGSNVSLWSLYNDYRLYTDPELWLPPYKSHAMLIGNRHFVTFDDRFVTIDGADYAHGQSYLLAHDFLAANFTLIVRPMESHPHGKTITLISNGDIFEIEINRTTVHIVHNQPANTLPLAIGDIIVHRDLDMLTISSAKGFILSCNLRFDVCWFELSGWYYGRTAGILGNMNNELNDDFHGPLGQTLPSDPSYLNSWALNATTASNTSDRSSDEPEQTTTPKEITDDVRKQCDAYFHSKLSPFASCFGVVDTLPYLDMCLDVTVTERNSATDPTPTELCAVALAYIEACDRKQLPLRVPDVCISCQLTNGSYVPEGTFVDIGEQSTPNVSDVVFIVEAKECNRDVFAAKNLGVLISTLQKELVAANLKSNRYAVLAFGSSVPPFNSPRSIVHNNVAFAESNQLKFYFEHIRTPTNSTDRNAPPTDVFEAISAATKLSYRPGAAKAFVLLPCSAALAAHQQLDYSSVLQQLREDNIQLHVLMPSEFRSDKKRVRQSVFGIDRKHAFTKHSMAATTATAPAASAKTAAATSASTADDLRQQIGLPKTELGLCAALAMESYGSIFTASRLLPIERNPVKKFVTVFGRRVAESAATARCQTCECTGHNSGIPYMMCSACHAHSDAAMDYAVDDDDTYEERSFGDEYSDVDDE